MRGAAAAIGWEFQRHHRLGLVALAIYLACFAVLKAWILGPEARIRLDPPNGLAGFVIAPLTITYFFFVGVFSYGLSGDLGARESVFPRRMFTLPVANLHLALWPMLYGTVASVTLWWGVMLLARWAGGVEFDLPWIWPALMMAVFLAWMQALTWLAYPLRGLRVVVAVLLLTSVDAIVLLAIHFRAAEAAMIALLAPQLLAAYALGWFAVSRARRGEIPDWTRFLARAGRGRSAKRPFASARDAQAWLEWTRHGRTLPALVALVVPFELLLLFIPSNDTAGIVFAILAVVLATPPAMALLAAPALSTFSTHAATRPLATRALVAAKLRMTMWSTACAWLVVIALAAAALAWSDRATVVVKQLHELAEYGGMPRVIAISLILGALLVAATWKNLVQSLCIGLTGNAWLVKSSLFAGLVLVVLAFPVVWLVFSRDPVMAFLWEYLPWIVAAMVVLKVTAGGFVLVRLLDRGVLGERAVLAAAVGWLGAVVAVYAVLAWLFKSPVVPFYLLGGLAILLVPLARVAAAPLALDASRHR